MQDDTHHPEHAVVTATEGTLRIVSERRLHVRVLAPAGPAVGPVAVPLAVTPRVANLVTT